jgi:hypothetical protein
LLLGPPPLFLARSNPTYTAGKYGLKEAHFAALMRLRRQCYGTAIINHGLMEMWKEATVKILNRPSAANRNKTSKSLFE